MQIITRGLFSSIFLPSSTSLMVIMVASCEYYFGVISLHFFWTTFILIFSILAGENERRSLGKIYTYIKINWYLYYFFYVWYPLRGEKPGENITHAFSWRKLCAHKENNGIKRKATIIFSRLVFSPTFISPEFIVHWIYFCGREWVSAYIFLVPCSGPSCVFLVHMVKIEMPPGVTYFPSRVYIFFGMEGKRRKKRLYHFIIYLSGWICSQ